MPLVGPQCVVMVFPDHTHLFLDDDQTKDKVPCRATLCSLHQTLIRGAYYVHVLIYFSLTVKVASLIVISGHGSATRAVQI